MQPRHLAFLIAVLAVAVLTPAAGAQFQVIFTDDFESGLARWSIVDLSPVPSTPLWRLAEHGDCGVTVTSMAAFAYPEPICTYATGSSLVFNELVSEPILLAGNSPYHLAFDSLWGFSAGSPGNLATSAPFLRNAVTNATLPLISVVQGDFVPGEITAVAADFNLPANWDPSHPVHIGFQAFVLSNEASTGSGVRYDNVVLRSSAYEKFGNGVPGWGPEGSLTPSLTGYGSLTLGSANALHLNGALPGTTAWLVFGLEAIDAPFKGGVLHPQPGRLWPMFTGTGTFGTAAVDFTLPELPAGLDLFFQFWIEDSQAVAGYSATNGLRGRTS